MKFEYTPSIAEAGPVVFRPLLRVSLRGPRGRAFVTMLVDSGADETLVGQALLERLGVPMSDEAFELSGLGGGRTVARAAWVDLSFGSERFHLRTRVMTSPALEGQLAVLGHRDFFNRYYVAFDAARRLFHVADPQRVQ